jgi:hypothetical protein
MALSDVHSHNMKELSKELAPTIATTTENSENNQLISMMEFVPPAEGTPAAAALQGSYFIKTMNLICFFLANAEVKISRLAKGMRKIGGIKHPKLKNVTRGFKLKKKKQVKFSRNFKGKVIDGVHELYTLTAGMMLGMRCAVSDIALSLPLSYLPSLASLQIGRSSPTALPSLALGDFNYVEKISFPPSGNSHDPFRTPPHNLAHTFKFKTYAPLVFSRIRDFFGVDSMSYMLSVCGLPPSLPPSSALSLSLCVCLCLSSSRQEIIIIWNLFQIQRVVSFSSIRMTGDT